MPLPLRGWFRRGWFATRGERREPRPAGDERHPPRCWPATRTPHEPTPKRTTSSSGIRKLDELAAVAEIESGRNAIASTRPSEMIESAIASSPSFTPRIRRSVPILTR